MKKNLTDPSAYDYHLPSELIAQYPCDPRDASRLMIIQPSSGQISEVPFRNLPSLLNAGDQLIFNNTKVLPARLWGKKASGAKIEVLLIKQGPDGSWEALVRPGRKLPVEAEIIFGADFAGTIVGVLEDGRRCIRFTHTGDFNELLERYGSPPLPPYIRGGEGAAQDVQNYQTIYAEKPGAVAAPTAGLHFTQNLLQNLSERGVEQVYLTLHVGLGTFLPVQTNDIRNHKMHAEHFDITPEAAQKLNEGEGRKICVGTTSCRALESAATPDGKILPGGYETDIFIYPGYQFKAMQGLITNFHLPKSSLLMLVSAFAGHELIMEAYAKAVKERFRFYSYGDAMLILG